MAKKPAHIKPTRNQGKGAVNPTHKGTAPHTSGPNGPMSGGGSGKGPVKNGG